MGLFGIVIAAACVIVPLVWVLFRALQWLLRRWRKDKPELSLEERLRRASLVLFFFAAAAVGSGAAVWSAAPWLLDALDNLLVRAQHATHAPSLPTRLRLVPQALAKASIDQASVDIDAISAAIDLAEPALALATPPINATLFDVAMDQLGDGADKITAALDAQAVVIEGACRICWRTSAVSMPQF